MAGFDENRGMSKYKIVEELLAGNPERWNALGGGMDFQNLLSSLLLPSSDYRGLLEELKRFGSRQFCKYQFKSSDMVWICKQCQMNDTSVVCSECYLASNHDGHEVVLCYSSNEVCSCGDCEGWRPEGFCSQHCKIRDDPTSSLPTTMKTTALEIFQLLFNYLVKFSDKYGQQSLSDLSSSQTYCLNLYYDVFHTMDEFQTFYTSIDLHGILQEPQDEALSLLQDCGYIQLRNNLTMSEVSTVLPFFQNSGFTVRALSKQEKYYSLAIRTSLVWMESLSHTCDEMCQLIGNSLTSEMLYQILCYEIFFDKLLSKAFHQLLLSLMSEKSFKMTSAIAYTLAFCTLHQHYSNGSGLSMSSMIPLSGQFLTRDLIIQEVCYHYDFLPIVLSSLKELIANNSYPRGRYADSFSSLSSLMMMEKQYLQSPAISHRRYKTILSDLTVLLTIPDINRLFSSTCLLDLLVLLDHLQELNPQIRSMTIDADEDACINASNLAIGVELISQSVLKWFRNVTSEWLFMKERDSVTKQHQNKTVEMISIEKVLEVIINYLFNWQRKEKDFNPSLKDLLQIKRVKDAIIHPLGLPFSLSQSQVKSFHYPLHRFFAYVVVELIKYPRLSDSLLLMKNTLSGDLASMMYLMKIGLSALSLSKEIESGLWGCENSVVMQDQLLNYSQPPFCQLNIDSDILLLQLSLLILPFPTFLTLFFLSFHGVSPYLFHVLHDSHYPSSLSSQDMEYLPSLIAGSLELLVNVVTELPPIPSEKESNRLIGKIRREWIHRLAGGNTTYSQLQESLSCHPDSDKTNSDELNRLLSEISTKQMNNPLSPPNYTLKRDLWIEYDPCFPHIPKTMHQIAAGRKPKPLKEEPMIKISPQATIHPFFHSLRDEMFFHEEFLSILRKIFFTIARQKITKTDVTDYHKGYFLDLLPFNDTVYSRALQLLTLIVQSLLEKIEEQSMLASFESNYETNKRKFFTFLLLETDSSSEQTFPSFLRAMYDLHEVFKSSLETQFNQYHLGWILGRCRELDSLCAEQLQIYEQEKLKFMNDNIETIDKSFQNQNDLDDVENEGDHRNILPADVLTITDHFCIICKIDRDQNSVENIFGYLALIQSSSVLWPKSAANDNQASKFDFHALDFVPSPDKNKFQKINSSCCNPHISFCGHVMHLDCYSRYQYAVKQRSAQLNHNILDAELSYFPCPRCNRLCNGFFPHRPNQTDINVSNAPTLTSNAELLPTNVPNPLNSRTFDPISSMMVINELWLSSNNLKQLYSCDRERSLALFRNMNESQLRLLWFNLIEEMFAGMEFDTCQEAPYPIELFVSSFAYTIAADNSNHILPGYHLDEIQQLLLLHTSYLREIEDDYDEKSTTTASHSLSSSLSYLKYVPDKDEIKFFSSMILCLSEIIMLSLLETLIMNSLFHSILGKTSQLMEDPSEIEINDRFWMKYKIPALLTLPLFDVIVLTSALDQLYYRQGVDMSVSGERFELIKILPWFGVAKLMQLLLPYQRHTSSVAKDFASLHPALQKIFTVTMMSSMDIPSLSMKDYQKVLGEWLSFIRAVIHLYTRNTQRTVNPIYTTYLQSLTNDPSLLEHFIHPITEETDITDEMIITHARMIGLDFILTNNWSEGVERLVTDIVNAWMTDFREYHDKYQRAMIASHPDPCNRNNDLLPNYHDLPEKRFYPSRGGRPHLIRLPEDYSRLYAIIASKVSFDYPALCLQCGLIVNGSGQGQCHAHVYNCGAGVGIFFLIQDCQILLCHGPRSCYLPSPYIDIYGEVNERFNKKPLYLESNRYAVIEQIWLNHQIPTEVMRARLNGRAVIMNGFY